MRALVCLLLAKSAIDNLFNVQRQANVHCTGSFKLNLGQQLVCLSLIHVQNTMS